MAHLWLMNKDEWAVLSLDGDAFVIGNGKVRRVADLLSMVTEQLPVGIRRLTDSSSAQWALVAAPGARVSVNGMPAHLGLAVLADRDEIRIPGDPPFFFSTEVLAHVEPFPEADAHGLCPRCKKSISTGCPAVRCPNCGLWYHQSDADCLPCWTYATHCAACSHATALDNGFRWSPEGL
jgi:hypothetical protein